jgi:hypothetical protein
VFESYPTIEILVSWQKCVMYHTIRLAFYLLRSGRCSSKTAQVTHKENFVRKLDGKRPLGKLTTDGRLMLKQNLQKLDVGK